MVSGRPEGGEGDTGQRRQSEVTHRHKVRASERTRRTCTWRSATSEDGDAHGSNSSIGNAASTQHTREIQGAAPKPGVTAPPMEARPEPEVQLRRVTPTKRLTGGERLTPSSTRSAISKISLENALFHDGTCKFFRSRSFKTSKWSSLKQVHQVASMVRNSPSLDGPRS